MATCTRAALITNGKCLTQSQWSQKEQDALMVLFMAELLTTSGGTDYTTDRANLVGALLDDSHDMLCGFTPDQREAAALYIMKKFADNKETPAVLATSIKCLKNATKEQLAEAKLYLLCALSNTLTYT